MKAKTKTNLLTLFFFGIYLYTFIINNLFYTSTYSADYQKYVVYLEYFFDYRNETGIDQSSLYYSLVAIILNFVSKFSNPATIQYDISFSIQLTNSILILFGFLGIYNLMKQLKIDKRKIILILTLLNFFPPLQSLKLTMKPEVIIFSLLPWLIYFLKNYLRDKNQINLIFAIFPTILIATSKGTGFAIIGLFLLIVFFEILKNLNLKQIFMFLILTFLILTPVLYENYEINNIPFLTRSDITENYENKASLDIIFKNDKGKNFNTPFGDIQVSTLVGVTLLDTFDDHFLLDWNKDVSLFKKHRKEIVQAYDGDSLLKVDFKNREIFYNGLFKDSLPNLRIYVGILFTILFYYFIFRYKDIDLTNKKIILSPLIGIFILYIHSLGIPMQDFDPLVADTFKTFYYSPFLVISFTFLFTKYVNNKKKVIIFTLIYVLSILYINGFPKKDSSEYLIYMDDMNEYNVLCEINIILINDLTNESKCKDKKEEFCIYFNDQSRYELETSRFLILKNVDYLNTYQQGINCKDFKIPTNYLSFSKLPYFNFTIYIIFFITSIYGTLRPDNIPFRIWLTKD